MVVISPPVYIIAVDRKKTPSSDRNCMLSFYFSYYYPEIIINEN